ncbi:MAG: MaoC/PaaZ C-terminal domain-containing protein [Anaerolineae bacterium]
MEGTATRGLYFEEFTVGLEVASPARTVTESDVMQFAGLSGDYNALHTDSEYAKATPYGQRIAHGLLGLSLASGLAARAGFMEGTVQAFTGLTWKFRAPVFLGDTIHLRGEVTRTRALPSRGGGMVVLAVAVLNQRGETVQDGEWSLLIWGKPAS